MEWYTLAILIVILLLAMLSIGLPVAFTMLLLGITGITVHMGFPIAVNFFRQTIYSASASQSLATVFLFVLMGQVLLVSKIGTDLYEAVYKWGRKLPGCLAVGSVASCAIFGAMCGSATATTATIGTIAVPTMLKYKYSRRLATGVVAAAGALGPVIPPSIYMIVYGVAAEESIGKLFIAAIIPGVILAALMIIEVIVMVKINPKLAPPSPPISMKEKIESTKGLIIPVLLVLLVLGTIYAGVCTPTEAAGVGAFGSIAFALGTKRLNVRQIIESLGITLNFSCMVMLLIIGGALLSKLFTVTMIPQNLATFAVSLPVSRWTIMVVIQLVIFAGGFVLEGCALIAMLTPVFITVVKALGFDPLVFGVAMMMNLATAVITPPFAVNLYVMRGIVPDVPFEEIAKGALWFLIVEVIMLGVVLAVPPLSTWLPSMM
ncbi:MAG TPA: TRAP transporter large permease subunit [Smithellaceae bacterium]|nr:TRAP transporter large permease subunit [Smithellaceae bacterium]